MAKAKKTGTALVSMKDLEKEMAVAVQTEIGQERSGGIPIIRTRGKKFRIYDEEIKGGRLESIILGTSFVNAYYEQDYDPDDPSNPECTAVGTVLDEKEGKLAPPPNVAKRQAEACALCPHDKMGSAEKGKGKRCRNLRRVILIAAGDERPEPQLLQLLIPPTGIVAFRNYVNKYLPVTNRQLYGFITTFTLDDKQDWPVPVPEFTRLIDDPSKLRRVMDLAKSKVVQEALMQVPQTGNADKPVGKGAQASEKTKSRLKGKR